MASKRLDTLAYWLRGFADGEGCVSLPKKGRGSPCVILTNTELILLETAQVYLAALGIKSRLYSYPRPSKPAYRQAWHLYILGHDNLVQWRNLIGFVSPSKQEKLARAIAEYKQGPKRLPQEAIIAAYNEGRSLKEVAEQFGGSAPGVFHLLRRNDVPVRSRSEGAQIRELKRRGA